MSRGERRDGGGDACRREEVRALRVWASPWRWGRRGEGEGREEEGKGRRELARPVGPRPLLHLLSFCHDCMILVNARPLVLAGRKRNQGGSDRAGRAARLTRFRPAPRLPLWYGGAERGRPCARRCGAEEECRGLRREGAGDASARDGGASWPSRRRGGGSCVARGRQGARHSDSGEQDQWGGRVGHVHLWLLLLCR